MLNMYENNNFIKMIIPILFTSQMLSKHINTKRYYDYASC
jgi:hypothetical protein